ncbi:MAG: MOSC domain-containing protein [Rhodospirillales bacterium]|nr:MAG: MOSC domain-containing protein [Rhodospirillales bacterium]
MTPPPITTIAGVFTYPIKGLAPHPLPRATLTAGRPVPNDRRWALVSVPFAEGPFSPDELAHVMQARRLRASPFRGRMVALDADGRAVRGAPGQTVQTEAPRTLPPLPRFMRLPAAPPPLDAWRPRGRFLSLANQAGLPRFPITYAGDGGAAVVAGTMNRLDSSAARLRVARALSDAFDDPLDRAIQIVEAPPDGHLADLPAPLVSLVGLATVRDLAAAMGLTAPVAAPGGRLNPAEEDRAWGGGLNPMRFRANIVLDGVPAWQELGWAGRTLRIGAARLRVVEPIERCVAIDADPAGGGRDLPVLETLDRRTGATRAGVYAEVIDGGEIGYGDPVMVDG